MKCHNELFNYLSKYSNCSYFSLLAVENLIFCCCSRSSGSSTLKRLGGEKNKGLLDRHRYCCRPSSSGLGRRLESKAAAAAATATASALRR